MRHLPYIRRGARQHTYGTGKKKKKKDLYIFLRGAVDKSIKLCSKEVRKKQVPRTKAIGQGLPLLRRWLGNAHWSDNGIFSEGNGGQR